MEIIQREYKREGNDCIVRVRKILTKFCDKYIVIVMTKYIGWNDSDIDYEENEFESEEKAIEFYKSDL